MLPLKIFIVEDDSKIAGVILQNLNKWGYEGVAAQDFNRVCDEFLQCKPALVLLDINLPAYDGFYWCRRIRQFSKVPIIFISARNANMDIVMAVNMGGDDYLTKPFSIDVLIAKVSALLRRTYSYNDSGLDLIEHRQAVLNLKDDTLSFAGQKLELTKNEFRILYVLMKEHGSLVSRERMMRHLWEDENFIDDNTLTVNINRLRRKLDEIGLVDFIQTKKNRGYIIP
ncbi:MAG TPA: response regulator transcription factor [Bacillota bacterium]